MQPSFVSEGAGESYLSSILGFSQDDVSTLPPLPFKPSQKKDKKEVITHKTPTTRTNRDKIILILLGCVVLLPLIIYTATRKDSKQDIDSGNKDDKEFKTETPTIFHSNGPTLTPTTEPTGYPTIYPTLSPTEYPTNFPTSFPTVFPTGFPTPFPSS